MVGAEHPGGVNAARVGVVLTRERQTGPLQLRESVAVRGGRLVVGVDLKGAARVRRLRRVGLREHVRRLVRAARHQPSHLDLARICVRGTRQRPVQTDEPAHQGSSGQSQGQTFPARCECHAVTSAAVRTDRASSVDAEAAGGVSVTDQNT